MIYRNEDRHYPSLLVEDGETVTISARDAHETGIPVLRMQPRTTAALLVLGGQPPPTAPRLSDRAAFERIERTDGFVNLSELDQDGRISGYSTSFLKGVLAALDPHEKTPPRLVKRLVPIGDNEEDHCRCSSNRRQVRDAIGNTGAAGTTAMAFAERLLPTLVTHSVREVFVPDFVAELKVFSLFTRLGDIVVGRKATLILDSDISFAIADNVLAYRGARIVQRASYLNLDVTGTMRGSLLNTIHTATDVLKVNLHALVAEPPTKP